MKTLESILSADFDIGENDIKPLLSWIKQNRTRPGGRITNLRNKGPEMFNIIVPAYGEVVGKASEIDWDTFLIDIVKTKDSIMMWKPQINFNEIWTGRKTGPKMLWTLHTQNPNIYGATWEVKTPGRYTSEDVERSARTMRNVSGALRTTDNTIIRLHGTRALNEIIQGLNEDS